ncbi:hypothetical protein GCM10009608_19570 [Pseudonocardia alaniniphila]
MRASPQHGLGRVVTSIVLTVLATCLAGCATPDAGVQEEWRARQWRVTSWTPVHDVESGVTASLLGPVPSDAGLPMFAYRSTEGPVEVETRITIVRRPDDMLGKPVTHADLQRSAELSAEIYDGLLISSQELTMNDYPATDVRIRYTDNSLKRKLALQRQVFLPEHLVILESTGAADEERVVGQVQQLAVEKLLLP